MTAALILTDWIPCTTLPVREGEYQIKHPKFGIGCADWDGSKWTGGNDEYFRAKGSRYSWRGVRRWVLQIPAIVGSGTDYVISVSRRGVIHAMKNLNEKWYPHLNPMTFATKDEAEAFAKSNRHLRVFGWKAVLP